MIVYEYIEYNIKNKLYYILSKRQMIDRYVIDRYNCCNNIPSPPFNCKLFMDKDIV